VCTSLNVLIAIQCQATSSMHTERNLGDKEEVLHFMRTENLEKLIGKINFSYIFYKSQCIVSLIPEISLYMHKIAQVLILYPCMTMSY